MAIRANLRRCGLGDAHICGACAWALKGRLGLVPDDQKVASALLVLASTPERRWPLDQCDHLAVDGSVPATDITMKEKWSQLHD